MYKTLQEQFYNNYYVTYNSYSVEIFIVNSSYMHDRYLIILLATY